MRNHRAENGGEKRERAVTEEGIPDADQKVAPELAGRNVARESRAPLVGKT